jgi:hypothetical protein
MSNHIVSRRSLRNVGLTLALAAAGIAGTAAPAFARPNTGANNQASCDWGGKSYSHGTKRTATYYIKGKKYTSTYVCNNGGWDVVLMTTGGSGSAFGAVTVPVGALGLR